MEDYKNKVSIIVPVYNTEKYLHRCLESLINQTLKEIEIILIDDGSTDKSFDILSEYAKKDSRIILLQQKNSKQGAARNKGLQIATGEFVTFVDSDDWIDSDYCEKLYKATIDYDVDIAAANMTRDKAKKQKKHLDLKIEAVYNGATDIIKAIDDHFETAGKLYKFSLIKSLRFEENTLYEDGGYTIRAIANCKSLVTVPNTIYHYVSNPKSTIKQKLGIKNELDKISTSLDLINFAEENNIKIKKRTIHKERHLLWAIKHYKYHKDYYLAGIKIFSKKIPFDNSKTFLVFNTACFGDVILCNSLCQNIKKIFPESRIVFITDVNWREAAAFQECVDEVVVYDKKGVHKGFKGLFKFVKDFKYKKIFASFITYKNERNWLISKLLRSRFVLSGITDNNTSTQWKHSLLLQRLTNKKVENFANKYNVPSNIINPLQGKNYIALCSVSKRIGKDIPIQTTIDLINKITSQTNYEVVFLGVGEKALQYAKVLDESGCKYIDLINKTTILELGAVLKDAKALICGDTGTLHYACAIGIPTVAIYYEQDHVARWAPNSGIYDSITISENHSVENILNALIEKVKLNEN